MSQLNNLVRYALDNAEDEEQEAIALLHYLMDRFGWSGTVMTRADAESVLERDLTDEEWEVVQAQSAWRNAPSIWNEDGITWECVRAALEGAGISDGE